MVGQDKKRGRRMSSFALDVMHIVTGVLITVFAVLAFLNPEDNMILFPVIFFLAGALNLVNGIDRLRSGRGRKKRKTSGMALAVSGIVLLFLCVLSAITIWWG